MTSLAETAVVAELETASSVAVPTLEIKDLTVCYTRDRSSARVLDHVSLKIMPGEAYGLVGESGSGKSTLAFSTVSYLAPNAVIESGEILFQGRNMLALDEANLRSLRGSSIAMVYQDPSSALNPTMRVGDQIAEVFEAHEKSSRVDAIAKAIETLRRVAFVNAEAIYERMPHQLSGGQQQRVVIAMALAGNPSLLVLDEPTTGLDLSVQAEVLRLVHSLHKENGMAMLFISHDLATVRRLCDRIGVMRHGVLLEEAESEKLFTAPEHPYTRGLLDCLPREGMHKNSIRLRPIDEVPPVAIELTAEQEAAAAAARCDVVTRDGVPVVELRNVTKSFGTVVATNNVNLTIHRGETLGLVGESGSGKSTLGRMLVGLLAPDTGQILLNGTPLKGKVEHRSRADKRALQMVFQRPDTTLNPRRTIRSALQRSIKKLGGTTTVEPLAAQVRLGPVQLDTVPRRLSGGMKQRAAIARAFAGAPSIVVCDEPTSALDPSIQASILNQLADISTDNGTAYLFISHDLDAVRYIADRVAVMYRGEIVEEGPVDEVLTSPQHPYTQMLLASSMDKLVLD